MRKMYAPLCAAGSARCNRACRRYTLELTTQLRRQDSLPVQRDIEAPAGVLENLGSSRHVGLQLLAVVFPRLAVNAWCRIKWCLTGRLWRGSAVRAQMDKQSRMDPGASSPLRRNRATAAAPVAGPVGLRARPRGG
jgi:hypothetical protein